MLPLGKKIGAKHKCDSTRNKVGGGGGGGGGGGLQPLCPPSPFVCHCLLLHARHAAGEGYHVVVTCSEDTDIFNMSLAFQELPCFKSAA